MTPAQEVLKPGDILPVRTNGPAAEVIRLGAALRDKPNLANHIALMHHWMDGVPWGLEGRPGGVGWVDLRSYLASSWTQNNCAQPGRSDKSRAVVVSLAERMIGTAYDWAGIADDTLRSFHMPDLFASTFHGTVPGHVVCSSYAAFLYERAGWDHPQVADRDTEPADWTAYIIQNGYSVKLGEA